MKETINLVNERIASIEKYVCMQKEDLAKEDKSIRESLEQLAEQELLLSFLIKQRDSLLPNFNCSMSPNESKQQSNDKIFIVQQCDHPLGAYPIELKADYFDTKEGLLNVYIGNEKIASFPQQSFSIQLKQS